MLSILDNIWVFPWFGAAEEILLGESMANIIPIHHGPLGVDAPPPGGLVFDSDGDGMLAPASRGQQPMISCHIANLTGQRN